MITTPKPFVLEMLDKSLLAPAISPEVSQNLVVKNWRQIAATTRVAIDPDYSRLFFLFVVASSLLLK